MTRATKAHKVQLLNAAYRLLDQRIETAEAARQLADTFALSLRQAYRYLEQAAALSAPVPVVEPTELSLRTFRTFAHELSSWRVRIVAQRRMPVSSWRC